MKQEKVNFTITVKQIDNGFVVKIVDRQEIMVEEKYCQNLKGFIEQVKAWAEIIQEEIDERKKS